jgi:hypothetical protein
MYETWISPQGVPHAVPVVEDRGPILEPVTGPCATCGGHHDVGHFANVRRFPNLQRSGPCVTETLPGYPYECGAKDKHPDHVVYRCATHGVWWHQAA